MAQASHERAGQPRHDLAARAMDPDRDRDRQVDDCRGLLAFHGLLPLTVRLFVPLIEMMGVFTGQVLMFQKHQLALLRQGEARKTSP